MTALLAGACRSATFPAWMRRSTPGRGRASEVEATIMDRRLHTVCREAKCPNRAECFGRGTATFLIMGDACTRSCAFCGVRKGAAQPLDEDEPGRVAMSVARLRLRHAVITSVTRDDLPDGGAAHFAATVRAIRRAAPHAAVETLVPDFQGVAADARRVIDAAPDVFNHNIETVPRLYPKVRPRAGYERSLRILSEAAQSSCAVFVKSGLMVGLGETEEEILMVMRDLRSAGCAILTIGQYLRPSGAQLPVHAFIAPEQFERYRAIGMSMGFCAVAAGPYVRSSYQAAQMLSQCRASGMPAIQYATGNLRSH